MIKLKKLIVLTGFMLSSLNITAQTCKISTIESTSPTSRFKVNNNGTIADIKTGLIWMRCAVGSLGEDCAIGNADKFGWQEALLQVQIFNNSGGYAGYNDWRIPNLKELVSITEKQCFSPAINLAIFPNIDSNWFFWTSTLDVNNKSNAWHVNFLNGGIGYNEFNNKYLRLVRG